MDRGRVDSGRGRGATAGSPSRPLSNKKLCFKKFQNFGRMSSGIGDGNPVFFDRAVRSDESRGTNRPFAGFALGIFPRTPGPVCSHDVQLRVGQEYEREIKFRYELVMGIDIVTTDAHNDRIGLRYCIDSVAEPARFLGSARCIILWIKPENHIFPGIIRQRMLFTVASLQRKRRSLLSFQSCHSAPPKDL